MSQSPEAMKVWKEAQSVFDEHPEGPFADTDAADVAAASVIEADLQKARDEERAAIVAWLREEDAKRPSDNYLAWVANRIQQQEHRHSTSTR